MRDQSDTISLKHFFAIIGCVLFVQYSFAQEMDFSRVVPPEGQTPRTFEDKLVQWAWFNSPENAVFKEQLVIAAQKKKITWWELLDATATFNLNESHLNPVVANENLFFPIYNFSLGIKLGAILSQPARRKILEQERKIIELEENQQKLKVRADVLTRYQDYELAVAVLKSKTQAAEEAESVYTLVSEQFQADKVDFKDFSAASANFYGANEAKVIAQTNVNKAKIALEELIGIPWDKAIKRRIKK